ncbi:MAG: DUF523 domain-containing protein [Candidatus Omnitrophica bacterium]|nr:DUF523 domain-containing protein [Candidatus Omnitrophota bacterium]
MFKDNEYPILCSACLLGIPCRYDGLSKPNSKMIELSRIKEVISVCPEQLGGLTTPRMKNEIKQDKVFREDGKDVTSDFLNGAKKVLEIAKKNKIKQAYLKSKSPACGCGKIYDGTFTKTLINGDGITAKLLKENGIVIISVD